MEWEQAFKEASFRGVPFKFMDTDGEAGRRLVEHVFPKRPIPYNEDMGRRPRTYNVNALVIGESYKSERDALLDACEKEGPGVLIHPSLPGELQVICESCNYGESTKESGLAWFQLAFREAGEARYPSAKVDGKSLMDTAAAVASTTFGTFFSALYDVSGPSFLVDSVKQDLAKALGTMKQAFGEVPQISEALDALDTALGVGESLVSAVTGAIEGVADLGRTADTILSVLDFDESLDFIPRITSNREKQAENRKLTSGLVKQLVIVEAIRAAAQANFESYNEAVRVRSLLLEKIEEQTILAGDNGDDELYRALVDLRTEVAKGMRAKGATLARIIYIEPAPVPVPSLIRAYEQYNDLDRAGEITRRNKVAHPGFMNPGEKLEILSA